MKSWRFWASLSAACCIVVAGQTEGWRTVGEMVAWFFLVVWITGCIINVFRA